MAIVARPMPPEAALPPCDERIVELYRYWLSIHPARGVLPGRQHFDPVMVPKLLPWIWLAEFEQNPLRFRYRLVGTEQVVALGRDATGKWLEEVHPGFAASAAYRQFVAAVERSDVGFHKGAAINHRQRNWMSVERLVLPMARNGHDVDLLLGISVFMPAAAAAAE
jgi:hypothetical protein